MQNPNDMTHTPTSICFYNASEILPEKGGIERVTFVLAEFFRRNSCKVIFMAKNRRYPSLPCLPEQYFLPLENKGEFHEFIRRHKIEVFINQDGAVPFPYPPPEKNLIFITALHFPPFFYTKDSPFLKMSKIGIFRKLPSKINRLIFKNPIVISFVLNLMRLRLKKIYRNTIHCCDQFIILSEAYKKDLRNILHTKTLPGNVRAIENPLPFASPAGLPPAGKRKEILWCGRIVFSQKRPDLLLRIWSKLQVAFPEWSLRFVGDGDYLPELKNLAGKLGLERVAFEGFQKPEPFYRDAAIFCMTSAYEGFGMVLVEAAAFGCVPVAFDSFAAVHDIIADGENGRIVPAFDLDKYAETLAELMSDNALRERLAQNALHIAEKFSPEKIGEKWFALFDELRQGKQEYPQA